MVIRMLKQLVNILGWSFNMSENRIKKAFEKCKHENRAAFMPFVTAGYPDIKTSQAIMDGFPQAGADIIEVGMPFSDPMADGPIVEAAGHVALKNGQTLQKTLNMVASFRQKDSETPIILMGYYNPIYIFGVDNFLDEAKKAGVDGLIVVDLPSEEDGELCLPALKANIDFIRLTTPTTNDERLKTVLKNSSGFIYYVSITGITGSKITNYDKVEKAVKRIKSQTELPVCVGFGIKTADDAKAIGKHADGVVIASVLIKALGDSLENEKATKQSVNSVLEIVRSLAKGVRQAR